MHRLTVASTFDSSAVSAKRWPGAWRTSWSIRENASRTSLLRAARSAAVDAVCTMMNSTIALSRTGACGRAGRQEPTWPELQVWLYERRTMRTTSVSVLRRWIGPPGSLVPSILVPPSSRFCPRVRLHKRPRHAPTPLPPQARFHDGRRLCAALP